jgi:hypothetical protein
MTDDQALAEARRRWGDTAKIRHQPDPTKSGPRPYAVGVQKDAVSVQEGDLFIIHGQGASWEEAFDEAGKQQADPSSTPQPPASS